MDINQAFPGAYLKAQDLQGRAVVVTISHVVMEEIGDHDRKPVVHFQGKDRGLVLNKTNGNTIAAFAGPETDAWAGRQVELYPDQTDFQGRRVACLRVRQPGAPQGYAGDPVLPAAQPVQAQPVQPAAVEFDDEIPF